MEQISEWIWTDSFWLPQGYTWKDLEPTPGVNKPDFYDLYYVPIFAILILCIRYVFERFIATPFCLSLGIAKHIKVVYEENQICEHVFLANTKHPNEKQVQGLAKQLGWTPHKVNRWFQKRRRSIQVPLLNKASESCWRCVFYFWLFCFGAYTILPTEWFYDTNKWMEGYIRKQDFNMYLRSYYLMELSFYTSLLFSQFIDAKRKDFYQMFLHHIVTIMLIFSSFAINHHRIGVVIMFLHDASDFWLEAAKVFNYAKKQRLCDGLFVMFAISFFITRWIYYPIWVLHAFVFKCVAIIGPWRGHVVECSLLIILQILHIYWGSLILHMVYKLATQGKVDRDTRSEDETSDGEVETVASNNTSANSKKKK
ncbi:ceramide synthase 5-like isoform X2 [Hydractinia symbiolongicarpus]|uniref:ceramide synthase 5-like isoform X2 n=1 Tax=Hydractinia symbiolongicarpus TaxID=13093 RepID=UPI00254E9E60|nr:ceramide synthase 5-like isoform X2 [Hydractinia symbiolongicarpus]